jgi:hypothetical protein
LPSRTAIQGLEFVSLGAGEKKNYDLFKYLIIEVALTELMSETFDLLLVMEGARLSSMSPSSLSTEPACRIGDSFRKWSRYEICEGGRSKTVREQLL